MGYFEFIRSNIAWLLAGFILALSSSFGQTFFISIFAGKIQVYFNLSHGDWGSIYMIGTLASATVMIWAGTSSDIFRARSIGVFVLVGLSLSTLLIEYYLQQFVQHRLFALAKILYLHLNRIYPLKLL